MQVDTIRPECVAKVRVGCPNLRTSVREVRLPHAFHDVGALQFATQKNLHRRLSLRSKPKEKYSVAERDEKK